MREDTTCQKDSSMKKDSTITPTPATTTQSNNFGLINTSTVSSISSMLSSAATNTQNSQGNLTGMVPVAFLPIQALLPCVQRFYDDLHAMHKLESNNMSSNNKPYNPNQPPQYQQQSKDNNLYDFENIFQPNRQHQYQQQYQQQQQQQYGSKPYDMSCVPDREYSTITTSSSTTPTTSIVYANEMNKHQQQQYQIEQLPQIECDRYLLDFGYIAEGCRDVRKFNIKDLTTNNINPSNDYYLLIEIAESNIKINNSFLIKNKQLEDDIKQKLKQLFYFNNQQSQKIIKLDTPNVTNSLFKSYEICFNVDTYDLNIFRESKLFQNDKEQQLTLDIQFKLTITCCFKSNNRKYFLCQIDSKLLLGYARLKTTANIDTIDFIVDKRVNQTTTPPTTTYSINESTRQRSIPLSNAGNIPINVNCYLFDPNIGLANYRVNIEPEVVYLDSNSKSKNVCLSLIKSESLLGQAPDVTSVNTKLIVEVMPNGFKYEIPVTIKLNEIIEPRKTIKILSNKTILHFSACDPNESALQELNLMNPNSFSVKCLIRLCTMNELNQEKSDENCYLFDDYHYTNNNNSSLNQTEDNDKTSIICEIKPQQSTVLKIKFKPLLNKLEFMNQTSICNGVVRIKTLEYDLRFNVKIVGFIGKSNVSIDGDVLSEVQNAQITNSQISKLFFNLKQQKLYQINIDTKQQPRNVRPNTKVNNKFSKELLIKNLSTYTKCFIKLIVLDDSLKLIQNLENNDFIKLSNDYLILEPNQKQILNVDISLPQQQQQQHSPQRSNFFYLVLLSVEFDLFMYCYQNIQTKLNEEQEKKRDEGQNATTQQQQQSSQFNVDSYISEMLFSSVNLTQFMTNNQDRLSILSSTSQQSSSICSLNMTNSNDYSLLLINTKKVKISKDDLIKYFKQSLNYSVVKFNCSNDQLQKSTVATKPQPQQIPESMFKRASPGNNRQAANQRYSLSVVNDMKPGLSSKPGSLGANFTRHSLNFDSINETVISSDTTINHLIDFTLNKSNDDTLDAGVSAKQTTNGTQDTQSWSILPTEIVLNVNEANFGSQQGSITITNNSNKEMIFDFIYRRPCLSIEPERGNLNPRSNVKIQVKLKKEILNKLPWQGAISVLCNKTQKDIRILVNQAVTQPPPPAPNTSSRNLLSSASKNTTTSAGYTTLSEQGSLLSELTQYSLDTMSLTPLMNATLLQSGGNANQSTLSTTKTKQTNNDFFLSSTTNSAINKSNINRTLNDSTQSKSNIKIVRIGNDAHITFAQVSINSSSCAELTLTNPTKNYVRWKAYSLAPAFIRANENEVSSSNLQLSLTQSTLMKSSYSVFVINPTSGVIPPNQKQIIKIEFYPREATGLFTQYWEIDTRSDSFDTKTTSQKSLCDSYNCKLVLNGVSVDAGFSVMGPTTNTLGSKSINIYENSMQSFNNKKAVSFNDSKENVEPLLGGAKALAKPKSGVYIKESCIEFPDTEANQVSKVCFLVNNTDNRVAKLTIMKLLEPFHCKHVTLNIKAKHYLKIPIEFQPVQLGNYVDKILVRVDDEDVPLTCILKGKCVKKATNDVN